MTSNVWHTEVRLIVSEIGFDSLVRIQTQVLFGMAISLRNPNYNYGIAACGQLAKSLTQPHGSLQFDREVRNRIVSLGRIAQGKKK